MIQKKSFRTAALMVCLCGSFGSEAQDDRPNIIHMFTDDLGWGNVGWNNPLTYIETPNLDALAGAGMILNRSYASTVCSPSRANLMTGTHNGHAINDRNSNIGDGLRAEDVTTGEVMQAAGYGTAIFGKWGWGANSPSRNITSNPAVGWGNDGVPSLGSDPAGDLPNHQGFDEFLGYLSHNAAHDFHYDWVWETDANGNMVRTANNNGPGGVPENIQDLANLRSEQYIRDRAADGGPFYLQLSYTAVHFDLDAVQFDPALRNLDGEIVGPAGQGDYASNSNLTNKQKNYAATVTRMDASVGAIIDRLKDPDGDGSEDDSILDNTLIIFSSDNGTTPEDGWTVADVLSPEISGGLRGGKRDLYDGGIRMPAFAYWNGTIQPGTQTDLLNDLADVQATAADLAGTLPRVGIDGVSILPTLTGEGIQRIRKGLLFENNNNSRTGDNHTDWTILVGEMKLIKLRSGVLELYNITNDPGETTPLSLTTNAALVDELEALAFAEGAAKPDSYATSYRDWVGSDGARITNAGSWEVTSVGGAGGTPDDTWSARLAGAASGDATALSDGDVEVLGIEIAGLNGNRQTLILELDSTLNARNEVRISGGGRVVLQHAALSTARWIDVLPGAELTGQGNLVGDVYSQGVVAPGQPADVSIAPPPPTEPPDTFTDAPATLIVFDFLGVQDNNGGATPVESPLTRTVSIDPALQIVEGFQTGPGTGLRYPEGSPQNDGDEWNVVGFGETTLADAIDADDYVGFVVAPVPGLQVLLDEVRFSFWRNGVNAPTDYALLTSVDGFTSTQTLATTSIAHEQEGGPGKANPAVLVGDYTGSSWVSEIDVRVYGWQTQGGDETGNTHFTAASLAGHFRLGGPIAPPETPTLNLTGALNLNGNFYQYMGSAIHIDLGGTDNADPFNESFDQIRVTGDVQLDGDLVLSVVEGYSPTQGDTVAIITSGARTGQFRQIAGVNLGDGLGLAVTYSASAVHVTAARLGDADLDGDIDDTDLGIAISGFTGPGAMGRSWARGDYDGDGDVDDTDLGVMISGFTGPLASANVPEPAAFWLVACGGLVLCRRRG